MFLDWCRNHSWLLKLEAITSLLSLGWNSVGLVSGRRKAPRRAQKRGKPPKRRKREWGGALRGGGRGSGGRRCCSKQRNQPESRDVGGAEPSAAVPFWPPPASLFHSFPEESFRVPLWKTGRIKCKHCTLWEGLDLQCRACFYTVYF